MNKIWFTSDTHYFHTNIINYCNRPFKNVDEMKATLIENWNSVVRSEDLVYHLGDFAMGGENKSEELFEILKELNGRIRLIIGNHDSYVLKSPCNERFEWTRYYYEFIYKSPRHGKRNFVIMHYPLYSWRSAGQKDRNGFPKTIHLHGHCHGNIDHVNKNTTRMDVGVDSHGYAPISIDSIIETMNQRFYKAEDHAIGG